MTTAAVRPCQARNCRGSLPDGRGAYCPTCGRRVGRARAGKGPSWFGRAVLIGLAVLAWRSVGASSAGRGGAGGRALGAGPAWVLCEQVASLDFDASRTAAVGAFVRSAGAAGGPRVTPEQLAEVARRFDADAGRVAAVRDLAPLLSADLRDEDVGSILRLFDHDAGKNQAVAVLGPHLAGR